MTRSLAAAVFGIPIAPTIHAQPVQAQPAFEVASVRIVGPSNKPGSIVRTPGTLTATNYPLSRLLEMAYQTQQIDISHLPESLRSERYEIHAKASGKLSGDQYWEMLRTLVEDRFKVKVHSETREAQVYGLVFAKNGTATGPKLTRSQDSDCPADPSATDFCGISSGNGILRGQKVTMARIARELSRIADRPVQDRTGLTGIFDFELKWRPDQAPPAPAGAVQLHGGGGGFFSRWPLFPAAVEEELGLKLKPEKGQIEVLVFDHLEEPAEN